MYPGQCAFQREDYQIRGCKQEGCEARGTTEPDQGPKFCWQAEKKPRLRCEVYAVCVCVCVCVYEWVSSCTFIVIIVILFLLFLKFLPDAHVNVMHQNTMDHKTGTPCSLGFGADLGWVQEKQPQIGGHRVFIRQDWSLLLPFRPYMF
jgi:hypothetical protein